MKFILNGKDITAITGEPVEFRGEILLPLTGLDQLQNAGIQISYTPSALKIDIQPEALLKLLSKANPFPADLELKMEKDKNGNFKAKAELSLADMGTASINQDGEVQAGIKVRL